VRVSEQLGGRFFSKLGGEKNGAGPAGYPAILALSVDWHESCVTEPDFGTAANAV
jgi:hypothetical protein